MKLRSLDMRLLLASYLIFQWMHILPSICLAGLLDSAYISGEYDIHVAVS